MPLGVEKRAAPALANDKSRTGVLHRLLHTLCVRQSHEAAAIFRSISFNLLELYTFFER